MTAADFCLASAGGFFLVGLVTGAWKYARIATAPDARAPAYVDTAHRSSLMYAFACALLGQLTARSAWSNGLNLTAAVTLVAFFAVSVLAYIVHGALGDTDNQFRRPHRLGRATLPPGLLRAFMYLLILGEIGGFLVILGGVAAAWWG